MRLCFLQLIASLGRWSLIRWKKRQAGLAAAGGLALACLPFFYWLAGYLNLDFWYDEVFSLTHFIFAPWLTTLTDYTSANNHIFFEILSRLYLSALNIRDLSTALDHPAEVRALMLVYTALTLVVTAAIGFKYFNRRVAVLAVLGLTTTLPYLNDAVQFRGYSLSLLLTALVVYFLLAHLRHPQWKTSLALGAVSTALIYTVPTNAYFIGGAILLLGAASVIHARKAQASGQPASGWLRPAMASPEGITLLVLVAASLLAGLLYLPALRNLLHYGIQHSGAIYSLKTRLLLAPRTLAYFLSYRYLLLLGVILGLAVAVQRKSHGYLVQSLSLIFVIGFPFAVHFLAGFEPVDRIFSLLMLPFVFLIALSLDYLLSAFPILIRWQGWLIGLVILYCQATLAFAIGVRNTQLLADIHQGHTSQNINDNYFQAFYGPSQLIAVYHDAYQKASDPLVILYYGDNLATPAYLANENIPAIKVAEASQVPLTPSAATYVLTAFPDLFLRALQVAYPAAQCQLLQPEPAFLNLYGCRLAQ